MFGVRKNSKEPQRTVLRRAEGNGLLPFVPPGPLGTLVHAACGLTHVDSISLPSGFWLSLANGRHGQNLVQYEKCV